MKYFIKTHFLDPQHCERNQLWVMLLIGFLITFIYEFLRPIKTALIVTAEGSGADIIPVLRMWLVLPCSFLITGIFSKLSTRFNRAEIFYFMISCFLIFFVIFTVFLYPYQKNLELESATEFLSSNAFLKNNELLLIIRYWHLSLFFVFCELWATVVLSILFWGYVNETTSMNGAKKRYGLLLLVGNSSVIVSGIAGQLFSSPTLQTLVPFGMNAWDKTVYGTLSFVLVIGLGIILLFSYLDQIVVQKKPAEAKEKINLAKIFKSQHLIYLTMIVIAYNISYNLIEVLWTSKLHQSCPNPAELSLYISRVVSLTGLFSILFALFVCRQTIQRFGWTLTALITPVIWLVTGLWLFFSLILDQNVIIQMLITFLDLTPLVLTVLIGAVQISLGRASKYTLFDQTKEMVFIPLPTNEQRMGKVWIEAIVTWVGKLIAALIYQLFLFLYLGESLVFGVLGIFFVLVMVWIVSVKMLGNKMAAYDRMHVFEKDIVGSLSSG